MKYDSVEFEVDRAKNEEEYVLRVFNKSSQWLKHAFALIVDEIY